MGQHTGVLQLRAGCARFVQLQQRPDEHVCYADASAHPPNTVALHPGLPLQRQGAAELPRGSHAAAGRVAPVVRLCSSVLYGCSIMQALNGLGNL